MTVDGLVTAVAAVVAALIGALIPYIVHMIRERRRRDNQLYKFVYVKLYHLTPKKPGRRPVYRRHIDRLERDIEVYDEFHYYRLNLFHRPQADFTVSDRSSGTVDLQIIHPWQDLFFPDRGAAKVGEYVAQQIQQPSHVLFTRTIYYNAFQEGNEDFAMKMERDTDEARLLIDFSSIPDFAAFINPAPKAVLRAARGEQPLGVIQTQPGIFMVVGNGLKKDDVIRIDFKVDWQTLERLLPVASLVDGAQPQAQASAAGGENIP
jgi:hypothetical protein